MFAPSHEPHLLPEASEGPTVISTKQNLERREGKGCLKDMKKNYHHIPQTVEAHCKWPTLPPTYTRFAAGGNTPCASRSPEPFCGSPTHFKRTTMNGGKGMECWRDDVAYANSHQATPLIEP